MNELEIEKLRQIVSRTDKTRNEKVEMLIEFTEQQVKNLNIPAVINCVPYQLCPKCGGDGDLLRYNSPALMGTNARPICDVCGGNKIIPMAHCL